MRLLLQRSLIALVVLLAVVYAYDYLSVHHRMGEQKKGDPFDTVTYPNVLAIPEKGNRTEYALDAQSPMMTEACVHSIFPHEGYLPCWYVIRKTQSPIPMFLLPAARLLGQKRLAPHF